MSAGTIPGDLLGRILTLLGEEPKRLMSVHIQSNRVTINRRVPPTDVETEHLVVTGALVAAPTLGDRLDRLVYASHLAAVNGERHYENTLDVIENGIRAMEEGLRGDR